MNATQNTFWKGIERHPAHFWVALWNGDINISEVSTWTSGIQILSNRKYAELRILDTDYVCFVAKPKASMPRVWYTRNWLGSISSYWFYLQSPVSTFSVIAQGLFNCFSINGLIVRIIHSLSELLISTIIACNCLQTLHMQKDIVKFHSNLRWHKQIVKDRI